MKCFRRSSVISITLALFLVSAVGKFDPGLAQKSAPQSRPFEPSEELYYEAEFSRSILRNVDVAGFTFRSSRTFLNEEAHPSHSSAETQPYSLTLTADVASRGFFTHLFNLNFHERVESTVEPVTFTVQRTTIQDEQGKRVRTSESIFDAEKGRISWTQRDPNNPNGALRNVVSEFSGQLQDILSAIYFIRMQKLEVGKSFEVAITDAGRVYRIPINVVEKKKLKTIFGNINAYRVDPQVFGEDRLIRNYSGELNIWLSDDRRRVPVECHIKTEYGTFDVKLKRAVYTN